MRICVQGSPKFMKSKRNWTISILPFALTFKKLIVLVSHQNDGFLHCTILIDNIASHFALTLPPWSFLALFPPCSDFNNKKTKYVSVKCHSNGEGGALPCSGAFWEVLSNVLDSGCNWVFLSLLFTAVVDKSCPESPPLSSFPLSTNLLSAH